MLQHSYFSTTINDELKVHLICTQLLNFDSIHLDSIHLDSSWSKIFETEHKKLQQFVLTDVIKQQVSVSIA